MQVPLPHGCLSHSSISETRRETALASGASAHSVPAGCRAEPLTHAHALIGCGLEAVVAGAAVAALRVDAVAVAAHVGDLLALVAI